MRRDGGQPIAVKRRCHKVKWYGRLWLSCLKSVSPTSKWNRRIFNALGQRHCSQPGHSAQNPSMSDMAILRQQCSTSDWAHSCACSLALANLTAVRLKVEKNQLVGIFGEIGVLVDGLKYA